MNRRVDGGDGRVGNVAILSLFVFLSENVADCSRWKILWQFNDISLSPTLTNEIMFLIGG